MKNSLNNNFFVATVDLRLIVKLTRQKIKKPSLSYADVCLSKEGVVPYGT